MSPLLIRKFFEGKCTSEEVHEILVWINSASGKCQLEKEFEKYDENMGGQGALDSEALFSKIKEKIKVKERSNPAFRDDRKDWEFQRKRRGYKKWYAIAAVMVLVGCLAFWGAKMDKSEHSMPVQKIEMITKSTSIGQKLQLTLVDGSQIGRAHV